MSKLNREDLRARRRRRIRAKLSGTAQRPRLSVFRSLLHIYAQLIDDATGHTLVSASSVDENLRAQMVGKKKAEQAKLVGQEVAKRAQASGLKQIVFDRGGYKYHGRVKALADGAREGGLEF